MTGSNLPSPASVLITGANRGLGLHFVQQFLEHPLPPKHLFATCRNSSQAEELAKLAAEHPDRLHILELDVTKQEQQAQLRSTVNQILGSDDGLNLLIHNAGIWSSEGHGPTPDAMRSAYETNCIGPLFLTQELLPLLTRAATKNHCGAFGPCTRRSAVVFISSVMASHAENRMGGYFASRTSKAALNMVMKNFSITLEPLGAMAFSVHPGWVRTALGGPDAPLDPRDSVAEMLQLFERVGAQQNGAFLHSDGAQVPL